MHSLHLYPIKSCRAVDVRAAHVTPTGFAFDRQWVVVREADGKFITQRQEPRLALVDVQLPQEALDAEPGNAVPSGLTMRVSTAGNPDVLEVPLDPPADSAQHKECTVWEWHGPAIDVGDAAAKWFSAHLGKPVRLVRYGGASGSGDASSDPKRRATDPAFAPAHETAFSDGFPYLCCGEASLAALNTHLSEEMPMRRFRPNIVTTGSAPFAEDAWQQLTIADVDFEGVKPCSRCKLTTVDQTTAVVGKEPLETLHTFRTGAGLGWAEASGLKSWKHAVFFGNNLVTKQTSGTVSVGDAVLVTKERGTAQDGALVWKKAES